MKIEVTEQEEKLLAQAIARMDETAAFFANLTHEARLDWLREHQYSHPISFEREIGGTVYTINAHFDSERTKTVAGKVERILAEYNILKR